MYHTSCPLARLMCIRDSSQLIIHATGRVSGKIRYGKLVVDEGGEFSGDINILSDNVSARTRPVMEALVAVNAAAG